MNTPIQTDPRRVTTLTVATANVLNLANPRRVFYANQDPYSPHEYERKIEWLGGRIAALNADVLAVQEVWDEAALKAAVSRSGLRYSTVLVPGAENNDVSQGAQQTPRVGIITRLELQKLQSFSEFPAELRMQVPGMGVHAKFERPPLLATLRMKHGQAIHVLTAHLKSKRPKFLQDAQGQPLEDREDEKITALASLRSLIMRGAEAAAMRRGCAQAHA
jgi:predicted extracellular nuclease